MTDVAIVGAGYVGVPLAQVFAEAGRSVLLVDRDAERVAQLNRGESYIEDVPSEALKRLVDGQSLRATTDYDELRDAGHARPHGRAEADRARELERRALPRALPARGADRRLDRPS